MAAPADYRIGMMAIGSATDQIIWSGTPYYAMRQLQRHFAVYPLNTPMVDYLLNRTARVFRSMGWDPLRERIVPGIYRRITQGDLRKLRPDAIFGVICSHKMRNLPPDYPVILMADALFATVTGYYENRSTQSKRTRELGNRLQQEMIDRASTVMLTSNWAADEAREHYRFHPTTRLVVAPIGPNMVGDPAARDDGLPQPDPAAIPDGPSRLLFVGFDWIRKGGPEVLALHALLRQEFPDLELDIVGCRPQEAEGQPGVTSHGVLRKDDANDLKLLKDLYRRASIFAMLSRQEAYGIVYAEASAFGLPSLARNTGGVSTLVRDGVNGLLFGTEVPVETIAAKVAPLLRDRTAYAALRASSRKLYESVLNWEAWGNTAADEVCMAVACWPEKKRWLEQMASRHD